MKARWILPAVIRRKAFTTKTLEETQAIGGTSADQRESRNLRQRSISATTFRQAIF